MNITLIDNPDEAITRATKWAADTGVAHLVISRDHLDRSDLLPPEMNDLFQLFLVLTEVEWKTIRRPGDEVTHTAHPAVPVPTLRRVIDNIRQAADHAVTTGHPAAADAYIQSAEAIEGLLP